MLLNLCRFAFGKINKLFLIMGGVWYLTGCTLTAEVNSLLIPPVAVESHRILEVSTDSVIVELSGRCPENVKVIKIDLDGRILQIVNEKSSSEELTGLTPGEISSYCAEDGSFIVRHAVNEPNIQFDLKYEISMLI